MGNYRGELDLFIYPERFGGEYGMLNHHYHEKFFFRTTTFTAGRGDVFLREKPENAFRVFVLGASTTESFPYGYNGMFSLVIRDMLEDVLPDRHVEVINLGITATNTYTLYDQTREILKAEPDANGAFYVPMKEKMSGMAENGIIGSDLMLEHLHPNSEGYFLMGKTFFESLMEANLPGLQPDLSRLKSPEEYREAMVLTKLDERMVWHRVQPLTLRRRTGSTGMICPAFSTLL